MKRAINLTRPIDKLLLRPELLTAERRQAERRAAAEKRRYTSSVRPEKRNGR